MHKTYRTWLCSLSLAAGLGACGGGSDLGGAASAHSADAHAAQQSTQAADDGGSSDTVLGRGTNALMAWDYAMAMDANISASFVLGGCTGEVTANTDLLAGTVSANVTFNGNCTGKRSVSGTEEILLKFGNADDSNRKLTVTEDLTWTLASQDVVTVSSLDEGPTATLSADNLPADGNVVLSLTLNEHRTRKTADGNKVFDMNITTADGKALVINNTYGASLARPRARTIVSGTLNVHHNIAKFSASHAFTNVTRSLDGTCACPESGTLVQTVAKDDKSGGFVRTYTFTGCGQANVVTSASSLNGTTNGTAQVTWNDCAL